MIEKRGEKKLDIEMKGKWGSLKGSKKEMKKKKKRVKGERGD